MSSTSSQELAASLSDSNEPGCEQSRSAKSSRSAGASSPSTGQASPSMTTCEVLPLTGYEQMELLPMSSVVASPARTSASPERRRALTAAAVAYGQSTPELLASYDPATSSWRTSQRCLVEGWTEFSETWPRSGTMRSGIAYQLAPLAPRTSEIESGLWPTPVVPNGGRSVAHVNDWRGRSAYHNGKKVQVDLNQAVKMWPTPTRVYTRANWSEQQIRAKQEEVKAATKAKGKHHTGNGFGLNLAQAVRMVPTPTARDFRHPGRSRLERTGGTQGECLPQFIGGALNPTWVEWLMGFPLGWTELEASETQSSRKSRKSSAARSSSTSA